MRLQLLALWALTYARTIYAETCTRGPPLVGTIALGCATGTGDGSNYMGYNIQCNTFLQDTSGISALFTGISDVDTCYNLCTTAGTVQRGTIYYNPNSQNCFCFDTTKAVPPADGETGYTILTYCPLPVSSSSNVASSSVFESSSATLASSSLSTADSSSLISSSATADSSSLISSSSSAESSSATPASSTTDSSSSVSGTSSSASPSASPVCTLYDCSARGYVASLDSADCTLLADDGKCISDQPGKDVVCNALDGTKSTTNAYCLSYGPVSSSSSLISSVSTSDSISATSSSSTSAESSLASSAESSSSAVPSSSSTIESSSSSLAKSSSSLGVPSSTSSPPISSSPSSSSRPVRSSSSRPAQSSSSHPARSSSRPAKASSSTLATSHARSASRVSSHAPSASAVVSPNWECGTKGSKAYTCPAGYCCSEYGWCGKSDDHCGSGCQLSYGKCSAAGHGSKGDDGDHSNHKSHKSHRDYKSHNSHSKHSRHGRHGRHGGHGGHGGHKGRGHGRDY